MTMALEGIKVIDCSQVAAVPIAARHLGDFGADVIHVENPTTGDYFRVFQEATSEAGGCAPCDFNYGWEAFNRNKRSMTLDLKKENGRVIMHKMISEADVFLSNLRSYELDQFELDYKTLSGINPRIIWGNINGYGKEGPDKDLPAYDATAYGTRAAVSHLLSQPGVPFVGFRPAMGDTMAGMTLAYGLMQALYVREKTGIGQAVNVSLFHTGLYQMSFDVSGALITGMDVTDWRKEPPEETQLKAQTAIMEVMAFYADQHTNPLVGVYVTKDTRSLMFIALQPDRYWEKFCKAVGREDLCRNPKYDTIEGRGEDVAELRQAFSDAFMQKNLDEWIPLIDGLPYAPSQSLLDAVNDVQAKAAGCIVTYDHPERGPIKQLANPVMMSKTPSSVRMPAPEFSQHTEEILLEFGYTWDDIGIFQEDGTIA